MILNNQIISMNKMGKVPKGSIFKVRNLIKDSRYILKDIRYIFKLYKNGFGSIPKCK